MGNYRLGKKPHQPDDRDLKLASFIDHTALPTPPDEFTYSGVVEPDEWGMLLNDRLGDCVEAAVAHAQLVFGRIGEHHPEFNDAAVERSYQEMAGYIPGDASTDNGTDMRIAAKLWQKQGVVDIRGHRHRSGLYVWLEPGNVQELWIATNLFKAGLLGFDLPQNAMEAFEAAEEAGTQPTWDLSPESPSIGGHCVPVFGRVEDNADGVSWGAKVGITPAFIENKMDSGFVVVTSSILVDGQIDGFDHERLLAAARQLEVEFG